MNRRNWRLKRKTKFLLFVLVVLLVSFILFVNKCPETIDRSKEPRVTLYLKEQNRTIELLLEDYILGSLAAEMPASFEIEALKAQAVCVRTYSLRKIEEKRKYPMDADLADDIHSCQAYVSAEEFACRHPQNTKNLWQKLQQAVSETRGEIMLYDGKPIDALYHSTCGGRTESAADVWGTDLPYLRSVDCQYCRESKFFSTVQVFSNQDLQNAIANIDGLEFKIIEKSPSGRVKKITINNQVFSGDKFREILNLPSRWWDLKIDHNHLIINSRGYGHGIGMCQYGANGMAKEGKKYREILDKYYENIQFYKMNY